MARSAASDRAFIDKIKTIGINTGSPAPSFQQQLGRAKRDGETPTCPDCGGPAAEVVGLIVKVPSKKKGENK